MPAAAKSWNLAALWAVLLAIGALAANFVFFANPPWQRALPWLSLLLAVAALVALSLALWRGIVHSQIYRGKVLSALLAVVALIVAGANIVLFFHARALPASTAAPQVGERVPDFTLADTHSQSVSLDSLFASPPGNVSSDASSDSPKAVLLIFYRGYW